MSTRYACQECPKDFAQMGGLTQHMRIHTGERNYECEFCSKTEYTKSNLDRHRRTKHPTRVSEKESTKFPCDICSHSSATKGGLNTHRRIKHSAQPLSTRITRAKFRKQVKTKRFEIVEKETIHPRVCRRWAILDRKNQEVLGSCLANGDNNKRVEILNIIDGIINAQKELTNSLDVELRFMLSDRPNQKYIINDALHILVSTF